ncbi:MAG TPA: hypothetical protein VLS92_10880 [Acidimicrobiia bacterium]|nr:hypothetical protein [Acidimicrobiia bacterium]
MRRLALMSLVLAVLAAACGGDGSFGSSTAPSTTQAGESTVPTTVPPTTPTTAPPSTLESTTTTTAGTTTTTAGTTTTTAAETFYAVDTTDFFPDVFPGANDAHGSGCVTPGFDALPNGVWFGFAEGVVGGEITFDLACFFTGAAAEAAAEADEMEAFDFYVRNQVATTFAVPISPGIRVWYISVSSADVAAPTEIPAVAWPPPDSYLECPGDHCSVWLYVNGGQVTAIVEQYLP